MALLLLGLGTAAALGAFGPGRIETRPWKVARMRRQAFGVGPMMMAPPPLVAPVGTVIPPAIPVHGHGYGYGGYGYGAPVGF